MMTYSNDYFASSSGVTKGEKHMLIPGKKRSVIFTLPKTDSIDRWLDNDQPVFFVRAMNTKKKTFRDLTYAMKKDSTGYKTERFSKSEWQAFSKLPECDESDREMMAAAIGRDIPERNLHVTKTNEAQTINDHECKKAVVQLYGDTCNVWYTESHDYSQYFDNYFRDIPGMVIRVENAGKILTQLVSADTPSDLLFTDNQIKEMFKK
ncbi:MAG: hypothetical protein U9Q98_07845 [Bacteroidota bacterium]|nr:hypothetical protein [Bacteroidota bacterium]